MQIDSVTYQQLVIAKWTNEDSLRNTKITSCTNTSSDRQDVIEIQEYEVVPSKPIEPIEKDSIQELRFLHTGLPSNVSFVHHSVTEMYQKHAIIPLANNGNRIDIFI